MSRTAAIVLAAGGSRRLGTPKQLAEIGGIPLLQQVLEAVARWPVGRVVVVLGAHADEVIDTIDFGDATIAINEDWEEGMAASIRVGLDLLARDASWERAFVVLGDQPGIPDEVPERLLETAESTHRPIVAPVYRYERGHPVLFDRSLWPRLMALSGDVGASGLLATHPEWVEEVRFSRSMPQDVDTRDDLADLRRGQARRGERAR